MNQGKGKVIGKLSDIQKSELTELLKMHFNVNLGKKHFPNSIGFHSDLYVAGITVFEHFKDCKVKQVFDLTIDFCVANCKKSDGRRSKYRRFTTFSSLKKYLNSSTLPVEYSNDLKLGVTITKFDPKVWFAEKLSDIIKTN